MEWKVQNCLDNSFKRVLEDVQLSCKIYDNHSEMGIGTWRYRQWDVRNSAVVCLGKLWIWK